MPWVHFSAPLVNIRPLESQNQLGFGQIRGFGEIRSEALTLPASSLGLLLLLLFFFESILFYSLFFILSLIIKKTHKNVPSQSFLSI